MFYIGDASPSPAGPVELDVQLREPPSVALPPALQTLRFTQRQIQFVFRARRELGDVFKIRFVVIPGGIVMTSHPDHVRSLFTAKPELVPSLTAESPLRPIVGPNSVLTANGPSHLRQRKLLLPPFHGEAIERYAQMIRDVTERELDRWPVARPFALAPRMQAITLDVIMSGIFGIAGRSGAGDRRASPASHDQAARRRLDLAAGACLANSQTLDAKSPSGLTRLAVALLDRATYPVIEARRRAADLGERGDILSLLLRAKSEDGEQLSDHELRDELLTLVLAGFETTANSLAWTWERLVRTPARV